MTRLKFERTSRHLSQERLSRAARLHQTEVSQIDRGRLKPTDAQLRRLAEPLRVAPDDLLKDVAVLGPSR